MAIATIRSIIRAILGDDDAENRMFSDETIDSHLVFVGMTKSGVFVMVDGDFSPAMTEPQKALAILEACKSILNTLPSEYSYRTPIHATSSKSSMSLIRSWVDDKIAEVSGGRFAASFNGSYDYYFSSCQDAQARITQAQVSSGNLLQ